jgi:hypothetical protein
MNRLIASAVDQASRLGTGGAPFPDDNAFLIVRADGARLVDEEEMVGRATAAPRKHLKNDGRVVTEIVKPLRSDARMNPDDNRLFDGGARMLTLRSFLTTNAIRSTHAVTGIDWCSSNNSTPCALGAISVPILVAAMGGNTGLRDNEMLYEMAASRDKDFVVVEGANHNIQPCTECETKKDQYGNVKRNFFNYVVRWMNSKF